MLLPTAVQHVIARKDTAISHDESSYSAFTTAKRCHHVYVIAQLADVDGNGTLSLAEVGLAV